MKTPAITNQYGETYTGMPNGRAMTIPGPISRRWGGLSAVSGGFSGVVLATLPMLRAVLALQIPPNVGAVPYGDAVDEITAAVDTLPAAARDAGARRAGTPVRPAGRGPDPAGGQGAGGHGVGPAGRRGARPGRAVRE